MFGSLCFLSLSCVAHALYFHITRNLTLPYSSSSSSSSSVSSFDPVLFKMSIRPHGPGGDSALPFPRSTTYFRTNLLSLVGEREEEREERLRENTFPEVDFERKRTSGPKIGGEGS